VLSFHHQISQTFSSSHLCSFAASAPSSAKYVVLSLTEKAPLRVQYEFLKTGVTATSTVVENSGNPSNLPTPKGSPSWVGNSKSKVKFANGTEGDEMDDVQANASETVLGSICYYLAGDDCL